MFICGDSWLEAAGRGGDPSLCRGLGWFGIHPDSPPLAGLTVERCAAFPVCHSNKCLSQGQQLCGYSRVLRISYILIDSQAASLAVTWVFFNKWALFPAWVCQLQLFAWSTQAPGCHAVQHSPFVAMVSSR